MRLLDAVRVGMFAAMMGIAAISAVVVSASVNEGDSASAWIWVAVFLLASILAALLFWRLV